jgi:hypothetical protein
MKNSNITDSDVLAHEVKIDLNVLHGLMLDGAGGEVHGADVITVDQRTPCERVVELLKQLA